jgi:hypothetical protein
MCAESNARRFCLWACGTLGKAAGDLLQYCNKRLELAERAERRHICWFAGV